MEISFCINSPSDPRTEANVIVHCVLFEISIYFLVKMITLEGKPCLEHSITIYEANTQHQKSNQTQSSQSAIWALLTVLLSAPDPGNFLPVAAFYVPSVLQPQTRFKMSLVIYDKFVI